MVVVLCFVHTNPMRSCCVYERVFIATSTDLYTFFAACIFATHTLSFLFSVNNG